MNMTSKSNRTPYHPNRFDRVPVVPKEQGGFESYPEKVEGIKARQLGPKFSEHVHQATMFYNSMSDVEKQHIIAAAQFEISKCEEHIVHQAAIERFNEIDHDFALAVAEVFPAVKVPAGKPNHGQRSDYLSQVTGKNQVFTAEGRKVGIYVLPGFEYTSVSALQKEFMAAGMMVMIVAPATGPVKSSSGQTLDAQFTFENCRSTYFDCVVFPGGPNDDPEYAKKLKMGRLIHVVREQYMHLKTIGATGNAIPWVADICLPGEFSASIKESKEVVQENGCVFTNSFGTGVEFAKTYMDGVAQHRCWTREVSHIAA